MSADVGDIGEPWRQASDWCERIEEVLEDIPTRASHRLLGFDEAGHEKWELAEFEGASPEGYVYAPGSEEELRAAVELLRRADRLLQAVRAREWTRCGNDDAGTLAEYLQGRRKDSQS